MDELTMCLRILAAAGAGLMIGVEREVVRKPAGMRTHMLVATAAAVLSTGSIMIGQELGVRGEALRVAAGVVTGIGFIGAGTILQTKHEVYGLTTAATVFMAAALGIALGGGLYWIGATGVALTLVATWGLRFFEPRGNQQPAGEEPRPIRVGRPAAPRRAPGGES